MRIVTRRSALARTQAEILRRRLLAYDQAMDIEIIAISTAGDRIQDMPLNKIGGKSLFVKELEHYLLENKAEFAIHSMKDVPAQLPDGLAIGAILERWDVRDVMVTNGLKIQQLATNARVGTSSLRRSTQLKRHNPALEILPLRGNVDTRLSKLKQGDFDAIVLAACGLERLGIAYDSDAVLSCEQMLPAVGQGALGIEYKQSREDLGEILDAINHRESELALRAERAMTKALDVDCFAPVAGLARVYGQELELEALVLSADASTSYTASYRAAVSDPEHIGSAVADKLFAQGVAKVLGEFRC